MSEHVDIVRRVSKLLALSADNPSEVEAQLAAKKAQDLMLGESITMADVASWENETGVRTVQLEAGHVVYHCDPGNITGGSVDWYGRRRGRKSNLSWRGQLGFDVAKYMGGKAILSHSEGVKAHGTYKLGSIHFFGLNADAIVEVYRYLELQLDVLSSQEMRDRPAIEVYNWSAETYDLVKPNGRYWRLSWLSGAVSRVGEVLKEQYDAAEILHGTELVLVRDLVNEKVTEVFPHVTGIRARMKNYDGNAYARGYDKGSSLDIGRSKLRSPDQIGS